MSQINLFIDICVKLLELNSFLTPLTKPLAVALSVISEEQQAFPYQVVPNRLINQFSLNLHTYVTALFLMQRHPKQFKDIVVFKLLVPITNIEQITFKCIFQLYEEEEKDSFRRLDVTEINFTRVLGIQTFVEGYFSKLKCSIKAEVYTHLVSWQLFPKRGLINPALLYAKCAASEQRITELINGWGTAQVGRGSLGFRPRPNELLNEYSISLHNKWKVFLKSLEKQSGLDWKEAYYQELSEELKLQICTNSKRESQNEVHISGVALGLFSFKVHNIITPSLSNPQLSRLSRLSANMTDLVVLVHGYGGSMVTMSEIQFHLSMYYPRLMILNSQANYQNTQATIQEMGLRLAHEVGRKLAEMRDGFRISFIAHSLGGLIVRAALPALAAHRNCMRNYISLGTPHLGMFHQGSLLNKFTMSAANIILDIKVFDILLMKDQPDLRQCYLYNMSHSEGISWFEEVHLYGSQNDRFVGLLSAVLETSQEIMENDQEEAKVWEEMRKKILQRVQGKLEKNIVEFFSGEDHREQDNLKDDLIGKKDHMSLAKSQSFIQYLLLTNRRLFL